jgi:hypothetical protein
MSNLVLIETKEFTVYGNSMSKSDTPPPPPRSVSFGACLTLLYRISKFVIYNLRKWIIISLLDLWSLVFRCKENSLGRKGPKTVIQCRTLLVAASFQDTGLFWIVFYTSYIFFGEAQFRPPGRPNKYMYGGD